MLSRCLKPKGMGHGGHGDCWGGSGNLALRPGEREAVSHQSMGQATPSLAAITPQVLQTPTDANWSLCQEASGLLPASLTRQTF